VSHHLPRLTFLVLVALLPTRAGSPKPNSHHSFTPSPKGNSQQSQSSAATAVPVFISDFELYAAGPAPPPQHNLPAQAKKPVAASRSQEASPLVIEDDDSPSEQARQLTEFFSITLMQSMKKSGYKVARGTSSRGPAMTSVLLRGVFAEADPQNRIRRAMLGVGASGGKFLLYVGTFNTSRPDQPLYQLATVQSADKRYGPIITPNSYIPLVKYEIAKYPTEDEIGKVCDDIARNLTALLNANPSAFNQ
jgi:Domain of unknown function (DUF4410)